MCEKSCGTCEDSLGTSACDSCDDAYSNWRHDCLCKGECLDAAEPPADAPAPPAEERTLEATEDQKFLASVICKIEDRLAALESAKESNASQEVHGCESCDAADDKIAAFGKRIAELEQKLKIAAKAYEDTTHELCAERDTETKRADNSEKRLCDYTTACGERIAVLDNIQSIQEDTIQNLQKNNREMEKVRDTACDKIVKLEDEVQLAASYINDRTEQRDAAIKELRETKAGIKIAIKGCEAAREECERVKGRFTDIALERNALQDCVIPDKKYISEIQAANARLTELLTESRRQAWVLYGSTKRCSNQGWLSASDALKECGPVKNPAEVKE